MEVAATPVPTSSTTVVPGEEQAMQAVADPNLPSSIPLQEQEQRKDVAESIATQAKLPPLSDVSIILHEHILVRPMYEVFSITINWRELDHISYPQVYKIKFISDGMPCHVFGLIRAFLQGGKTFDIYNRTKDNPEIVNPGGLLSINTFTIVHTKQIEVAVYLFDSAHDVEIANGTYTVDQQFVEEYDQVEVREVEGEYGLACICHATFQHGVAANIESIILKEDGEVGLGAHGHLVGTVSAHLNKIHANPTSEHENEFPSVILFNSEMFTEEMKFVQFGRHINLSRTCLVVPVFYNLTISANFRNSNGENVSRVFKLKARREGLSEMSGKGVNCEMELKVKWCDVYAEEECMDDVEPIQQSLQVSSGAEPSSPDIASAISMVFPCVEVFSVVIYVDETIDTSAINGVIMINDSSRVFYIFQGQDIVFNGKSLTLKSPPCSFDDEPFKVFVFLVNEKNRVVSRSIFEWNWKYNESHMLYNDKLLCSILPGDIGYAAAHYSMMTYGVQAKIEVSVLSTSLSGFLVSVYGTITARYGSYEYSCIYNKVYYQSIVFSRSEDDPVTIDLGLCAADCVLPLTKSLIAVPSEDLLILEVNLIVDRQGEVEVLEGILEFKTNVSDFCNIGGEDYAIRVTTQWSDVRYFPDERELRQQEPRYAGQAA